VLRAEILLGSCTFAGLLLCAQPARAQATPIALEYRASPQCPTEAVFLGELRARTANFVRAEGSPSARRLRIAVDASQEAPVGRLDMAEPSGEKTTREVIGRTCRQVVAALALVTALALDPNASTAQRPDLAEPPPLPPASATLPVASFASDRRWRMTAAVHAGMTGAVPPGVTFAVPVFVELGMQPAAPRGWTPSARIGFERSLGASVAVAQGSAEFVWTVGRLDLCAALGLSRRVAVGPCVGVDVGALAGAGAGAIANRNQASRPWVALGALARVRWEFLPPLFLEIEAGAIFPMVRDVFVFQKPQISIYSVPFAGPRAEAGIGAYFW
jgi:hypothetical protein